MPNLTIITWANNYFSGDQSLMYCIHRKEAQKTKTKTSDWTDDKMKSTELFYCFLSDPGKPGVRSMGPDVGLSETKTPLWNLTNVTLADKDTNSILSDNANRAI